MSLSWYIGRLRNMSAAEIAHRVGENLKRVYSRNRHQGWSRFRTGKPGTLVLPGLREAVLRADAAMRTVIADAAESVLEGGFSALGVAWPARDPSELFPAALWRLDPATGKAWPGSDTYCFDIDFRQVGTLGDIKYVWEINRLQFLQPLACHAALSGDGRAIAAIEAAIGSWHANNPPFGGVGWASGIEVALRAISLLLVTSLCGERLSARTQAEMGDILAASAFWLHRFPSRFSSANNHLMAELAGEYLIACAIRGMDKAQPLKVQIEREVLRQILPDGVGAEQSPSYAAFTAEMALLCGLVGRAGGAPFSEATDARLHGFADFVFWLAGAGETVPAIGDDDEGRALTLGRHEAGYVTSVAAAIAGYCAERSPIAAPAELRNLLSGPPAGAAPVPEGLKTFDTGGYTLWHGDIDGHRLDLVFDHGPLGYLSIAAHGHADALAITLAIDAKPVLVDPGTYLYQSGGPWRRWLRGTRAHNTLTINGEDQSAIAGPFNWIDKAQARLDARTEGDDWSLCASHDGYLKRFGIRHERSIARVEHGIAITDRLLGAGGTREAEIVYQLAPDLRASVEQNMVGIHRGSSLVAVLHFPTNDVSAARGGEIGEGGWVSTAFGSKHGADRLAWRGIVGPDGVSTTLYLP